jgi:hypothetical protein
VFIEEEEDTRGTALSSWPSFSRVRGCHLGRPAVDLRNQLKSAQFFFFFFLIPTISTLQILV